jgi:hypothetical protein
MKLAQLASRSCMLTRAAHSWQQHQATLLLPLLLDLAI